MTEISQEKINLIEILATERAAATEVTALQGTEGIIAAYGRGNTIHKLEKLHSRYNSTKGRIYPFYDDDDFSGPHSRACGVKKHEHGRECSDNCPTCHGKAVAELVPVASEDEALGEIIYHWGCMTPETSFSNFAHHLSEMENSISNLITFHPGFDLDSGEIK